MIKFSFLNLSSKKEEMKWFDAEYSNSRWTTRVTNKYSQINFDKIKFK
jgi:hypothetical protein